MYVARAKYPQVNTRETVLLCDPALIDVTYSILFVQTTEHPVGVCQ